MSGLIQRTLFCAFCDEPATLNCLVCGQSLCAVHSEKTILPGKVACPSCLDAFVVPNELVPALLAAKDAAFDDEPYPSDFRSGSTQPDNGLAEPFPLP